MIIILFETTLLIFEIISKMNKISRLRIWCTIFAIKSIEKIHKPNPFSLMITFLEPKTNNTISKVFYFTKLKKEESFLKCYLKQLEKFKVNIETKIYTNEVEEKIDPNIEEIDKKIMTLQIEIINDKSKMNDLLELLRLVDLFRQ